MKNGSCHHKPQADVLSNYNTLSDTIIDHGPKGESAMNKWCTLKARFIHQIDLEVSSPHSTLALGAVAHFGNP